MVAAVFPAVSPLCVSLLMWPGGRIIALTASTELVCVTLAVCLWGLRSPALQRAA